MRDKVRRISPAAAANLYGTLSPSPIGHITIEKISGAKVHIPANRAERRRQRRHSY